jgi:hypothetical protein
VATGEVLPVLDRHADPALKFSWSGTEWANWANGLPAGLDLVLQLPGETARP